MTKNALVFAVVAGIFGVLAFFNLTPFRTAIIEQLAGSPVGTTFSTAKIAAVNISPATSAASSTSIVNTDASTRIITDNLFTCVGTNGQGLSVLAATTSVLNEGLQGNTNYIMNDFATTTTNSIIEYVASSSEGVLAYTSRLWLPGVALTFVMGTTSTFVGNGGACTVGVHYIAS